MPERKTTVNLFGVDHPVSEVPIIEAKETAAEYRLEDGSTLRVRYVANSILRVDGMWEADGSPVYLIKNGVVVTLLEPGAGTKKPSGV